jgi:hypothetical protein
VRTGAWRLYVVGYLASSLLSLLTSVLVIIYSATGLAKDAGQPYGVIKVKTDSALQLCIPRTTGLAKDAGQPYGVIKV